MNIYITCVSGALVPLQTLPAKRPSTDDPEIYKGAPVGVQLVGPTLQEEALLGVGKIVDAAIKAFSA